MSDLDFSTDGGQDMKAALQILQQVKMEMSPDDPMRMKIEDGLKRLVRGVYLAEQTIKGLIPPDEPGLNKDLE